MAHQFPESASQAVSLEEIISKITSGEKSEVVKDVADLREVILDERRFGPSQETLQRKYRIVDRLNKFIWSLYGDKTFADLCR